MQIIFIPQQNYANNFHTPTQPPAPTHIMTAPLVATNILLSKGVFEVGSTD